MAIITCPECGGAVSDKAECCLKCGCPMSEIKKMMDDQTELITCPECGADVNDTAECCLQCGCPMSEIIKMINNQTELIICQECGEQININDEICQYCGYPYGQRGLTSKDMLLNNNKKKVNRNIQAEKVLKEVITKKKNKFSSLKYNKSYDSKENESMTLKKRKYLMIVIVFILLIISIICLNKEIWTNVSHDFDLISFYRRFNRTSKNFFELCLLSVVIDLVAIVISVIRGFSKITSIILYMIGYILFICALIFTIEKNFQMLSISILFFLNTLIVVGVGIVAIFSKKRSIGVFVIVLAIAGLVIVGNYNSKAIVMIGNEKSSELDQIMVTEEYVNIREKASINSIKLGEAYNEQYFDVISIVQNEADWYEIKTSSGIHGYVNESNVLFIESKQEELNDEGLTSEEDECFVNENDNSLRGDNVSQIKYLNLEVEEKVVIEDVSEFYIEYVNITDCVSPPKAESYYSYYSSDSSKLYVDICFFYKNINTTSIVADELMKAKLLYGGMYEYDGFIIIEEDNRSDFTYANITSIAPLTTEYIHYLFEVPQEIKANDGKVEVKINIGNKNYSVVIKAGNDNIEVLPSEGAIFKESGEVEINEIIAIREVGEFFVDYSQITVKVEPQNSTDYYSYYESDDGKKYVDICFGYKNLKCDKVFADDIIDASLMYDDNYEYSGFPIIEEDNRGDFTYANITSIKPLNTEYVHYLFEVPNEVDINKSVRVNFTIGGNNYHYFID